MENSVNTLPAECKPAEEENTIDFVPDKDKNGKIFDNESRRFLIAAAAAAYLVFDQLTRRR
jgi:hypothetical protein